MGLGARLPELPCDFVVVEGASGVMACRAEDEAPLLAAGFTPDGRHRLAGRPVLEDAEESGREPLGALVVAGVACLARRFSHGGLARFLTGRRFRDPARPFHELLLSEALRSRGIPTPRVVAARAVPARPAGFELTLVTERAAGAVDLGHLVGEVRRGTRPRRHLLHALDVAGALVGALHAAGCYHADLQPANLLVDRGATGPAWILDLDRSRLQEGALPEGERLRNLTRLWRHVSRREREYGGVLLRRDLVRFLRAYGVPRSDWRRWLASIDAGVRRGAAVHGLGWWLERCFGRGEDARAAGSAR